MSTIRRDGRALPKRIGMRSRKGPRAAFALESLESRTLLAYTFSLVGQTATVSPVAATGGPILIDEVLITGNPFLEWSQDNGVTFSADWDDATPGDQNLPATTASTINLTPTTGAGSSITLGDLVSPASNIFARFFLGPAGTPANNSLTIDDRTSTHAAGTYDFYSTLGSISGPGGTTGGINFASFGPVNSYLLEGGPAGNTFDIHSTFNATTVSNTIVGGDGDDTANVLGDTFPGIGTPLTINLEGGTNIVNVGNGNTGTTISSTVQVTDPTTLNINDTADTTHSTATLGLSGNPAAPFQVTGLGGAIQYGTGVTALNVNGGTFGGTGVTYDINNTQAGTATTVNGGPNDDTFNLSDTANNLSDLAGPVVINGNGGTNSAELFDQNGAGGAYAIDGTTVAAPGFAGLTYGTLTNLTLGSANNASTIDVNDTDSGGTLNVNTGVNDGSTVNVLADNEQVNITGDALTSVNIGSTGGPGSMANIQGPILVTNPASLTDLVFHDENDATGQTWTLNNDDSGPSGSVGLTGSATTSYNPFDLGSLTVNAGSGGNTFIVNGTSAFYPTTLNTGTGDDTTNVLGNGANTLDIHGQAGQDAVILGADPTVGMQNLFGTINVDNGLGFTDLTLDDSADTTGQTALLFNDGTNGQVTGLSPATINYVNDDTSSLTVKGGSGGNTFTVDGTISNINISPVLTSLNTGQGDDTTFVEATAADGPLDVHGQAGQDSVLIGNFGSLADILGTVTVDNDPGFTDLTIDSSADPVSHDFTLASSVPTTTISAFSPADITYTTDEISSLTINTNAFGDQVMNIDMSGGNPIPFVGTPGLTFNAGADFGTAGVGTHAINIFGELPTGPFATEVHNANDPNVFPQVGQYGSISFDDGQGISSSLTSINYTGLLPIADTTPAVNYTFNDFADDQSFTASDGPVVLGFQTLEFANTPFVPPPTFETTDIANKNFVTFNANAPGSPAGINGTVDVPTASDGLLSLTFNTLNAGDDTVSFVNTPPGVVTSLNGGADEDVTNVTGLGVADGTVLFLNGGASTNTLNYDAGGEIPTITPGLLPGEVLISIPGAGIVDAINYQTINIVNVAPIVITPGPAATINTVEGFQNVNTIAGTFTAPIPIGGAPAGFPANDFTASIDWGDLLPSDPGAGTITQDASNPSVYYITGTHTFLENGTYAVSNSVAFAGGTLSVPVNGVTITINFGPSGPTAGTDATANVSQGPLVVSTYPVVGTEGIAIPAGPIATFIDAGGADPIGDYSASISVFDSLGNLVMGPLAGTITQNADAAQFTVNAPTITLLEEGTYKVVVSVTDSGGATPLTVAGASSAVIADAPLTPGAPIALMPQTGIALPASTVVATFTDGNTFATPADFIASIDWGDGSPLTTGIVVATATPGDFNVEGGHIYAKPGAFATKVTVIDDGGSQVVVPGTSAVTDQAISGATQSFTAVEGKDTGLFVLATFTDPNTLATVADVNAVLAIGGWGDGKPANAGVTLVVQQIGVTPLNSANNPGAPIFEVLGSHVYAEETPAGLPDTLSVIITTLGGVPTTLTSPPGGGVTVLDAPLTSSNGTTIRGIEGNTTGTVLLGTFTDANQGATTADFLPTPGGNGGSVIVDWGDGSAPETLAAGNLAAVGAPNGVIFTVRAAHIYAEEGTYAYNVTVNDDGGAVTIFSGAAVIADAALSPSATQPNVNTAEASLFPVPVFGKPGTGDPSQGFVGPVASFTDANPTAPLSDFTATIDWGDGTPMTAGTISQPGGVGTAFIVSGAHIYADAGVNGGVGTYGIQVFIQDEGGARVTVTNTANVLDRPILLTGILNPRSDSGLSTGTPDDTNDNQPDFFGNAEPLSHITLYATLLPSGLEVPIGTGTAGADGSWNVESRIALGDGRYLISASAIDQFGVTTTLGTGPGINPLAPDAAGILRAIITPVLTVDTQGPVVTGAFFNRLNGQVDYTIQDPGGAPSGVWIASLLDSSNYELTKVHPEKNFPGRYYVSNVTVTPDPATANAFDVAVTFNGGRSLRGGFYLFNIRDSSNGAASVQDLADNHLDGEFYGSFPSGNHINGGDFVAELQAYHNKVFAPQTIIGTANAANGGVGGKRVNPVHSGVFVPTIPRGGSPIFSTPTSPVTAAKKKTLLKVKVKQAHSLVAHHATLIKHALVLGKKVPKGIHGHS
jgi:hypothetical protein